MFGPTWFPQPQLSTCPYLFDVGRLLPSRICLRTFGVPLWARHKGKGAVDDKVKVVGGIPCEERRSGSNLAPNRHLSYTPYIHLYTIL